MIILPVRLLNSTHAGCGRATHTGRPSTRNLRSTGVGVARCNGYDERLVNAVNFFFWTNGLTALKFSHMAKFDDSGKSTAGSRVGYSKTLHNERGPRRGFDGQRWAAIRCASFDRRAALPARGRLSDWCDTDRD